MQRNASCLRVAVVASLLCLGAWSQMVPKETLVFVDDGQAKGVVYLDQPWRSERGALRGAGNDQWLIAERGIEEGDFHITARLTIHGLRKSAARFSFNQHHSFGFEGNHEHVYITNYLTGKLGSSLKHKTAAEIGVQDGKPFLFEVVRKGNAIAIRIDGKEVYRVDVPVYTFDTFGFDPRRAEIQLERFSATGHFSPDKISRTDLGVWHHPKARKQDTKWMGPFVNLPQDEILTVVNVDGGIRAFVSRDDGANWQPAGRIVNDQVRFGIRDGNADTLLLRTTKGTLLCAFLNIFDEKISWNRERQEPNDDMKRYTWLARSFDDGRTWSEVTLIQKGFCGALRDMIQLSTGELVLVGQDMVRNPGRNLSFTYTSTDDGVTWTRSNNMDIGGKGDHAGSIEGTLTERRDGRLWILLRSYHGFFYECFSTDKGLTWTKPVPSTIKASGSPGFLQRLQSGRLCLLWNRFAKGRPKRIGRREELSMAFSEDDGKTWTEPEIILRNKGKRQSYPRLFERRAGELWINVWQGLTFIKLGEQDFVAAPTPAAQ
ncbi:MAG: exo-alpha-sialidase [Lentisphaerae bacterium]|jgi:sialidase-1|nr:exo-alpha-sialidase [Lentisphaerota bacterium]MBT4816139.1 exo-alpha-sialidase [Lentisphaerota bacterium]MBT5607884.1 exo-alpha-sialidase [Lentisphaerota bacterium]MBT7058275.1 exo-alpha-sialidase [Lentisphaerota bacterium]MBT7842797.1 exo-alpha-sialidase [Lentisphaerota bacterium]